ncbi:VOC family protein [Tomitella fengzijianii]|uniref:VOC family protein n=1 Tax=Tomitella fengzijianii TaxID=2597660 RepID=A0A516X6B7_9ACTN|nr:VOC family protein [Tomitella fengzijianii]QDQ98618.1 VOC family protein [Tomitella fengzijianii]
MSAATNNSAHTAADGAHTVNGTPRGFTSLTPFLVVSDAAAAIDFYVAAFGAIEVSRVESPAPDGEGALVAHAELDFGDGRLQLGDPNPQYGLVAAARPAGPDADSVSNSMTLYRPDVDAVVERALAAGATLREPVTDFVSGDRFASLLDPVGRRWNVMTRTVDISEAESARRVDEWAAAGFPAMDG